MEYRILFEPDGSFVTLTVTGPARVDGFVPYLEALAQDPAWRPGTPVLVDYRAFDLSPLRFEDVERILALHLPYVARIGRSPIAVVVSRAVDFGMLRMWGALATDKFPVQQLFYDMVEATQWLHTLRGPGPTESPEGSR